LVAGMAAGDPLFRLIDLLVTKGDFMISVTKGDFVTAVVGA